MHKLFSVWKSILFCLPVCLILVVTGSSCFNTRHLTYMQGQFDTTKYSQLIPSDPVVQKSDLLSIIVYSDNPEATKIYNQVLITTGSPGTSAAGVANDVSGASPSSPGYPVDENGNIEMQGLGLMHVEGLTRSRLRDTLDARLRPFLNNPYFSIRFLNYRFTMLGEVTKPGIYSIPGDRVNILQALGMAGDMTFFGRRDNVLIIRESDGKRQFARLDLTKPDIMGSPYYYLQQNDIVYFEASKKKVSATDQTVIRNVSIISSIISVLAILYGVFHK